LPALVPALPQSQAYVVDLTEAYDDLAALVPGSAESAATVRAIEKEQRQLRFNPVTAEAAADLRMDQAELKTYLATRLARHLTGDCAVKLVQFHPSLRYFRRAVAAGRDSGHLA
jgi:hypothetical protein